MLQTVKRVAAGLPAPLARRLRRLSGRWRPGERELGLVAPLLDPARAFLDVGANKGTYVEAALGRCSRIVAVEPFPALADYLRQAFAGRVEVLEMALSNREGSAVLHVPSAAARALPSRSSLAADPGFPNVVIEVRAERLDQLPLPPLGLIKIDVEGHEGEAIEGAIGRLKSDRPSLLIEIEEARLAAGSSPLLATLRALGYGGYYLQDGSLHPLNGSSVAVVQTDPPAKGYVGWRDPGSSWINNFLFLHRDDVAVRQRLTAWGHPVPAAR